MANLMKKAWTAFPPELPYMAAGAAVPGHPHILEIFQFNMLGKIPTLNLEATAGSQLQSAAFDSLCWGKGVASEEFSAGIIAGSVLGKVTTWNAGSVITGGTTELKIFPFINHTGGLEFSEESPNLLACGVEGGRICLMDMAFNATIYLEGAGSDTHFLSWNKGEHHILASTSVLGGLFVWDSRRESKVISLSEDNPRHGSSIIQWNPYRVDEVMVASDDDQSPSLKLWDIRKPGSPIKDFPGHNTGVIAMSWCPHDHSYVVSCAKDGTIYWDTINGRILDKFSNTYFDVHFHPKIPKVISASSSSRFGVYKVQFDDSGCEDLVDERIRQIGRDHMFRNHVIPFDRSAIHTGCE